MNKTTEALKLAEEALSFYVEDFDCAADVIALAAIREALSEPVKQEPVAWMWVCVDVESRSIETGFLFNRGANDENTDWTPLYAAPVDAKAIRAEALEEAKEIAKTIGGSFSVEFLAAIRVLK